MVRIGVEQAQQGLLLVKLLPVELLPLLPLMLVVLAVLAVLLVVELLVLMLMASSAVQRLPVPMAGSPPKGQPLLGVSQQL